MTREEINFENQKERLSQINNQIKMLVMEKKAIQNFIESENDRLNGKKSIEDRAYELREDAEFIKSHGRKRFYWEIGNILGYSEVSIKRIFKKIKKV